MLKIFWLGCTAYGDGGLTTDYLQFGFQQHVSANMCTWMVLETIDYFTKNGSEVFICVMDMKEAFDLAKWRKLSEKLLARNIPPVFLRLLLDMYADDLFLMVPTLDGLQTMIQTCESYAKEHNLVFSTHKCKTKCLTSLKKDRELRNLRWNGTSVG